MSSKRILLITDSAYPYLNANSGIIYQLARYLNERFNCVSEVLAVNYFCKTYTEQDYYGVKSHWNDGMGKIYQLREKCSSTSEFFRALQKDTEALRFYIDKKVMEKFCPADWEYPVRMAYKRTIRSLLRQGEYDCIICAVAPKAAARALVEINPRIPRIVYKLDPWSTNRIFAMRASKTEVDREVRYEKKSDAQCAYVITTNENYQDMRKMGAPMEKYRVLDFPNIVRPVKHDSSIAFDEEQIHCVYAGSLAAGIREPHYVLSIFEKLADNNIVLHIFGEETSLLPKVLPSNVIFHGKVSSDTAGDYMMAADVLINIGNSIRNMIPSKLLTYFSMGKPVLNFTKIEDCPTLRYMEKYPLGLSVMETEVLSQPDVNKVRDFILANRRKQIPFEEIEKRYCECTPEYVGSQVYSLIESLADGSSSSRGK